MTDNTLQATCKGELRHLSEGKRIGAQIRLTPEEHQALKASAVEERRSMAFIAYRRYLAGLALELAEQ